MSPATLDSFSYAYDEANELQSEVDYGGASTSYTYDPTGQLIGAGTQTYSLTGGVLWPGSCIQDPGSSQT